VVIAEAATLRLVFCGTSDFAVPSLLHLHSLPDFKIASVLTQPDRPSGRGKVLRESPIKKLAPAIGLTVLQPVRIREPGIDAYLREIAPDVVVVIAYGQIIPERLLAIPRLGWINLHASLLPKYRGAAPIHWAIANGEVKTGVTTMRIDAGMDTGDILLTRETPIESTETTPKVSERLAEIGAPLLSETLRQLDAGVLRPLPQNSADATYAPILRRDDGRIDWRRSALEIYDRMRAFTPWPGAFTDFRGSSCHIAGLPVSNHRRENVAAGAPGTLLWENGDLLASCGHATLMRVISVKLEGRKETSALEFANGARLVSGERFGQSQ
jgi:methionyl-tRNA formyltransferase